MITRILRRISLCVLAAGCAGALLGLLEGLVFCNGNPKSAAICAGLTTPLAMVGGFFLGAGILMLFGGSFMVSLKGLAKGCTEDSKKGATLWTRSLAVQAAAFFWLAWVYHLAVASLSAFHHMGLASLVLLAALIVSGVLLLLFFLFLAKKLEPAAHKLTADHPKLRLFLATPGPFFLAASLAVILSPVEGTGLLGFWGLLKRDELELAFLPFLVLPPLLGLLPLAFSLQRKKTVLATAAMLLLTGAGLAASLVAATSMESIPEAGGLVTDRAPLSRHILLAARGLTDGDGDGAARRFGGGDCDDSDPSRYPGAVDYPGNGVDEDCSGDDAEVVATPTGKVEKTESKVKLPENLSLVMITVDALRGDMVGTNYHPKATSNMDALAAQGILFEKAYAMSSFTGRAIGPFLMGRHPSETYCDARHLSIYSPQNVTLAEALNENGFQTAAIQGHPYFKHSGIDQGFNRWEVEIPPGDGANDQKITSDGIAAKAVEILEDHEFTKGRFFLWAHFMDPHKAYKAHKEFDFGSGGRARYDGEVAFTDKYLGKIVDTLKERGLSQRTVIMVTSDHGEAFGEHDIYFHGRRLWEEVIHVPWIWVVPGLEPRRVESRVSQLDLVQTACEILGIDPSEEFHGASLLPLMTGESDEDRVIFLDQPLGEYMPEMYGYIHGDYKLIHSIAGNRYLLFDLAADPQEKSDLSKLDGKKLEEMKSRYQSYRANLELRADRYKRK